MMLQTQIKSEIPDAMRAKDRLRLDTLRGLVAAFTNELVATKRKPDEELADEDVLAIIRREVKKRKEAADAFRGGGRAELAGKEEKERAPLEAYLSAEALAQAGLPAMMSRDDIKKIAIAKKAEMFADLPAEALAKEGTSKAGQLVGALMKELKGKADGSDVKAVVDELFV